MRLRMLNQWRAMKRKPNISTCSFFIQSTSKRAIFCVGFETKYFMVALKIFSASAAFSCANIRIVLIRNPDRSCNGVCPGINGPSNITRTKVCAWGRREFRGTLFPPNGCRFFHPPPDFLMRWCPAQVAPSAALFCELVGDTVGRRWTRQAQAKVQAHLRLRQCLQTMPARFDRQRCALPLARERRCAEPGLEMQFLAIFCGI